MPAAFWLSFAKRSLRQLHHFTFLEAVILHYTLVGSLQCCKSQNQEGDHHYNQEERKGSEKEVTALRCTFRPRMDIR